ncbi:hypothetical protein K501DRAFT_83793 [Backusella circina FSU 941]|nr:hypothetical protein K501DRAFT_83793 [Backusella circina FSU 941]
MEKSFANLLRHSRLASYDSSLTQVYKTPKHCKKIGDWGLKRNLPTVIRTPHVTIGGLDTAEHQTPWESGESKVLFVKRWKENFPNSRKPASRPEEIHHNVASMTPAEFQRFLKKSQKKAGQFQEALKKKELVPEQVFEYLNANFAETVTENGGIVGPTYSEYNVGWDYPVQGRILNQDKHGFAIGIGGVVASLPRRKVIGLRNIGNREVRTFFVQQAELDEQGKPKVEVLLKNNDGSSSVPLLNDNGGFDIFYNPAKSESPFAMDSDKTGFKSRRRNQGPETDDNIKPNPEHTDLMARISGLLENNKKN